MYCLCSLLWLLQANLAGWPCSWIPKPALRMLVDPLEVSALTPFKRVYRWLCVYASQNRRFFSIADRKRTFLWVYDRRSWSPFFGDSTKMRKDATVFWTKRVTDAWFWPEKVEHKHTLCLPLIYGNQDITEGCSSSLSHLYQKSWDNWYQLGYFCTLFRYIWF